MSAGVLGPVFFSGERQRQFAKLSGDWNPIHIDAIAARRTQLGRPVVHGIHAVLCALEALRRSSPELPLPAHLSARFVKPLYVDDEATFVETERDTQLRIQACIDGAATSDLRLTFGDRAGTASTTTPLDPIQDAICRDVPFCELAGCSGTVFPAATGAQIAAAFPHLASWLGAERVAGLLCLSRLVGMECPGLHSLFSALAVAFSSEMTTSALCYRVASLDERFRLLKIDVDGLGLRGQVEAFARHPPVRQLNMEAVSGRVARREFAGRQALVIGGSRGLGEVTAKLLAAGGARPLITYAVGKEDADEVADEIKRWGGDCDTLPYDVRAPASPQLAHLPDAITHCYYFASCHIFRRRTKRFDAAMFDEFLAFYVRGFYELCQTLRTRCQRGLSALYPSSVSVEERPQGMTEYAMAKAAAEILCDDLKRGWPGLHIHAARLPRLLTDQTATMAATESADPVAVLLPLVRMVQAIAI
jgi:NAD(P)-dependent dehydrogenase (short-subunit alcohol dehydrogenase family)/acyl dehydratase